MTSPTSELRAFAHPLRLQILSLLTASAMSAAEVARQLGTTQANASYHVRRLHAAGLLEVAEDVQIRGGRARRYRHDPGSGGRLHASGTADHLVVARALADELVRRTEQRVIGVPGSLVDAELWIEPTVWDAIREEVRVAMHRLHAEALPAHTPGAARVSATVSLFTMTGPPRTEDPA